MSLGIICLVYLLSVSIWGICILFLIATNSTDCGSKLINVSALPRPNFIAIDEGWGSLDQEHISAVTNLFEYFRTKLTEIAAGTPVHAWNFGVTKIQKIGIISGSGSSALLGSCRRHLVSRSRTLARRIRTCVRADLQ